MQIVLFVVGLALLIVGAELLVRGASKLARSFGIPSLIVGLTVVAFGTSAPEFAVSVKSALTGQSSIAVGNVVGSNIFSVLFILGLSALISPLVVSKQLIRFDVPLMIGASILVFLLAWDHRLTRLDGSLLFGGLILYTAFLIYHGRKHSNHEKPSQVPIQQLEKRSAITNVVFIIAGLVLLVIGSRLLVNSAVAFAQFFGVSELLIGLTIVAAGTSLPEVVTSIIASLRGERDIAVGNVVGSNLFNLLGVLGLSALVAPTAIDVAPSVLSFDLPLMISVAFACLPIFFTGGIISRWEGGLLFAYYFAYTAYLILMVTRHEALPVFHAGMMYFVIPLTVVTLTVTAAQAFRRKHKSRETPKAAG
ncbi:MAG: calcium/sodium antiporter [Planctomycetota bacterium]|nr:calcium/sodium antiporter [Planctomycetota bacterium]MDA1142500.1 calcium/sodium antiporter [Planctomycetota bacterium]